MGPPVHRAGNCGFLSVDSTSLPHWNRSPTQEKSFSFNWRPFFCFFCVCVCVCVCVYTDRMAPAPRRQPDSDGRGREDQGDQRLEAAQHAGPLRRQRFGRHVAGPTPAAHLHAQQRPLQGLLPQLWVLSNSRPSFHSTEFSLSVFYEEFTDSDQVWPNSVFIGYFAVLSWLSFFSVWNEFLIYFFLLQGVNAYHYNTGLTPILLQQQVTTHVSLMILNLLKRLECKHHTMPSTWTK